MKTNISKILNNNLGLVLKAQYFLLMIFVLTANGQNYVNIVSGDNNLSTFDDGGITTNYNTIWDYAFDGRTTGADFLVHTENASNQTITFDFNEPFYDLTFEYHNRISVCCDQRIDNSIVTFWADPEDGSGNLVPYRRRLFHTNEDYTSAIRVSPHTNTGNTFNDSIADIHTTKFVKVTLTFGNDPGQNFREIRVIGVREGGTYNTLQPPCNLAQTATFNHSGINMSDFGRGWSTAFDGNTSSLSSHDYTIDTANADGEIIGFSLNNDYSNVLLKFYNRIDGNDNFKQRINGSIVTFYAHDNNADEASRTYKTYSRYLYDYLDDNDSLSDNVITVSPYTDIGIVGIDGLDTNGNPPDYPSAIIQEDNPNTIHDNFYMVTITFNGDEQNFREIEICGIPVTNQNDTCWVDNNGNGIIFNGTAEVNTLKTNYLLAGAYPDIIENTVAHFDGRLYISEQDTALNPNNEKGLTNVTNTNYQNHLLWVEEGIVTNDMALADVSDWPDYVFEQDYKLNSLKQLKAYISKHGHLPTIPSAKELAKNGGYSQVDMTKKMVKTVEEITLHILKQEDKINELQSSLNRINELIKTLED